MVNESNEYGIPTRDEVIRILSEKKKTITDYAEELRTKVAEEINEFTELFKRALSNPDRIMRKIRLALVQYSTTDGEESFFGKECSKLYSYISKLGSLEELATFIKLGLDARFDEFPKLKEQFSVFSIRMFAAQIINNFLNQEGYCTSTILSSTDEARVGTIELEIDMTDLVNSLFVSDKKEEAKLN